MAIGRFLRVLAADGGAKFPPELGVLATRDYEEVLRFNSTCGWDETQLELLQFLRELHGVQPFLLHEVEGAAIRGVFDGRVTEPALWAERMLAVCPPLDEESEEEVRERFQGELEAGEFAMSWDDPR